MKGNLYVYEERYMNKYPLVSIIVPVYNVEIYLERCVKSIAEQSYPNFEVILIDDGSTDSSGMICDVWSKKSSSVRVIHKENGGLSSARNAGLDTANGEYILFVDSDDWIHRDMLLVMTEKIGEADIVCCGMIRATDNEMNAIEWFDREMLLEKEDALDLLVENRILTSHIMNKLYSKQAFSSLRFPEGKIFEDIRISHKIFLNINKIYILPQAYYYYYVREDSISNIVKLKNRLEWIEALKERFDDLQAYKEEYGGRLRAQMAIVSSLTLVQNSFTVQEKKEYKVELKKIEKFLQKRKTCSAVRKYGSKTQWVYYWLARILSYHANRMYQCFRGK